MMNSHISKINLNKHFTIIYLAAFFIFCSVFVLKILPSFLVFAIYVFGVLYFSVKIFSKKNAFFYFLTIAIFFTSFLSFEIDIVTIPLLNISFNGLLLLPIISLTIAGIFLKFKGIFPLSFVEKLNIFYFMLFLIPFIYGKGSPSILIMFYIYLFFFLFLMLFVKRQNVEINKLLLYILYSITLINIISLIIHYTGFNVNFSDEFGLETSRMFALWGSLNSNRFSVLLGVAVIINIHLMKLNRRGILFVNLLLLILSLILTYSRMGILATIFIVILYYIFLKRISLRKLFSIGIFLSILYFLSNILIKYFQRGNDLGVETLSSRDIIWIEIVNSLLNDIPHTIIGYGVTNNPILNNLVIPVSHAHNGYLEIVVETGLIGLFIYLIINLKTMKLYWKAASKDKTFLVLFSITLLFMIGNLTESLTVGPYNSSMLIHQFCIVAAANYAVKF
ncbi:MAG: O-antigen ligase family protein [Flavobacteriaceae bacterium]|nr:O-antigen ligase family protein [Flavobacteriaceae bacterium]